MLMNRVFRTKVAALIMASTGKAHKEVRETDKKKKEQQKNYALKYRRARVVKYEAGDKVLLRQTKTKVKPPHNPEAYEVKEIGGAEVMVMVRRGRRQ